MAPDLDAMLSACDAGLLIGDPALLVDRTRYLAVDLAEEWRKHTGKAFVFAFWAVRNEALKELAPGADLAGVFQRSRDHGLAPESLAKICEEWSARLGLNEADVRGYLTENIHYSLDSGCLEGLELYYHYAAECGALPAAPELRFLTPTGEAADLAGSRRAR
jgi:chorismate dehydratase